MADQFVFQCNAMSDRDLSDPNIPITISQPNLYWEQVVCDSGSIDVQPATAARPWMAVWGHGFVGIPLHFTANAHNHLMPCGWTCIKWTIIIAVGRQSETRQVYTTGEYCNFAVDTSGFTEDGVYFIFAVASYQFSGTGLLMRSGDKLIRDSGNLVIDL